MGHSARILITKFPYSSTFGGGEKHTLTLVERLQQRGYHFYLLSTCSVLVPEFQKRGWPVRTVWAGTEPVTLLALLKFFFTAPFIWCNLLRWLWWYRRHEQITTLICLSLTEKILLTPWARLFGMNVFWIEHLQIERWLLSSPLRWPYVLWSRLVTIITVVTAVKQQLIQLGVLTQHVQVIYNAIDLSQFTPHPSALEKIQQRFDLIFIGRLATEKGVNDLITAVALLKEHISHVHLTIVGTGDLQQQLEQLQHAQHLEQYISFVGFQADIRPWLQRSDVLVLPATRRETFGIVLAEALAMEKPVVATTVGGLPEVIGHNGWLVAPHDPIALSVAITDIYQNYPAAVAKAQAGRRRVVDLFSEDRMIEAYARLLVF